MSDVKELVQRIHASPHLAVVAVAGGGSQALAWLLEVPGASRTLLESIVPYGRLSMIDFLGHEPSQFASAQTAQDMARAAHRRGVRLREDDSPLVGLACTATLATDRPKRGDHRCYIAAWDDSRIIQCQLTLDKGARDRTGEEELVSRLVLNILAQACGIETPLPLSLTGTEHPKIQVHPHAHPIQRLLSGEVESVLVHSDGRMAVDEPIAAPLLPGSFRPLHYGHRQLAQVASQMLGKEVVYELSVVNVDKPPLAEEEVRSRVAQFQGEAGVALTRAETFHKKAKLCPGITLVIGWDTAVRLVEPRYYGGEEAMHLALAEMGAWGSRFLVAGREHESGFYTLADVTVPPGFGFLFRSIPESSFRADISSTAIRAEG